MGVLHTCQKHKSILLDILFIRSKIFGWILGVTTMLELRFQTHVQDIGIE